MAEDKGADWPRHISNPVSRERGDDGDRGVGGREEDLRKDERGGGRVDEEVIIFERRADPAAGGRDLALMPALRLVRGCCSHSCSSLSGPLPALVIDFRNLSQLRRRGRGKAEE